MPASTASRTNATFSGVFVSRLVPRPIRVSDVSPSVIVVMPGTVARPSGMWRRSVEDCQVELAEALGGGEDVHLDDPSVPDREARDRERPPVPDGDRADRTVDERRPHLDIEARESERLAGHVGRSADNPRGADGSGTAVGPA